MIQSAEEPVNYFATCEEVQNGSNGFLCQPGFFLGPKIGPVGRDQ